ncbi:hypothetical protein PS6_007506 [Mucor atramentarius]
MDDEDVFTLLPPKDNLTYQSEESDEYVDEISGESESRNVFSDQDESDNNVKSTSKLKEKKAAKLKEKKPTTSKRKTTKATKQKPKTAPKASTKLPSIFSDAILPNVKSRNNEELNNDELAFSDFSGEEDANDSQYTHANQKSNKRKKKRAKKQESIDESESDEEEEEEEEEEESIVVFKRHKDSSTTKEYTRANLKTTVPLKKYSPFAQFNKEMRSKIAQEHREAINMSGEPQKQLSRLVADAWKAMPEAEKDKFKQKLSDEKKSMSSVARQKLPRPSGNGYILYSKFKLPQLQSEFPEIKSIRELSAIVGKHWKALEDDEREVYKAKAKKEREDWIRENPEQHQQYMDKMTSKIRATKKARRGEN